MAKGSHPSLPGHGCDMFFCVPACAHKVALSSA
jgi:hypothetical protein